MVNLNEVLSRSGISELISFLGVDTYKLLTNMEGESWSPLDLADLVIDVVGIENIFTNKKFRNVLIGSLKKTELKELAKTLDFDENTLDLYNKVKEISFSKFSQNMERLLFYFGKVPFEKIQQILINLLSMKLIQNILYLNTKDKPIEMLKKF